MTMPNMDSMDEGDSLLITNFVLVLMGFFHSDYTEILSPNEQLPHLIRMNASKVRLMKASLFEMEIADDGNFVIPNLDI